MTEDLDAEAKAQLARVQAKDPAQSKQMMLEKITGDEDYQRMSLKVNQAIKSGTLPKDFTFEKGMVIAQWGREMGVSTLVAVMNFFLVNGKIGIAAAFQKAKVHEKVPAALFKVTESSAEKCVIVTKRNKDDPNEPQATWIYTIEEAKLAQLTGKDNWKKYPADMLRNRCITRAIRGEFSDVFLGPAYDPEELEDSQVRDDGGLKEVNAKFKKLGTNVNTPILVNEESYDLASNETKSE